MLVFIAYVMYQEDMRAQNEELSANQQEQTFEPNDGDSELSKSPDRLDAGPPIAATQRVGVEAELTQDQPAVPARRAIPISTFTLENENITAQISNGPALIKSWQLRDYEEYVPEGETPIELIHADHPVLQTDVLGVPGSSFVGINFEIISQDSRQVTQRAHSAAGVLTRTIRLDERGFGFDLEMTFENGRGDPVDTSFEIIWPAEISDREDFRELSLVAYGQEEGVTRTLIPSVGQPGFFGFGGGENGVEDIEGRSRWAGFDIQYFTGVVIDPAEKPQLDVRFEALEEGESAEARMTLPSVSIVAGGSATHSLRGFLGPKTPEALEVAGNGLNHSVNRGFSWLEPLTRFLEIALDKLYSFIPNYGLAIIVLTILVRICTAPLMAKQMRSAEKMRALQPRMKELQERFKDDRQKQSEETMKLYREEGVNPLGGCLPLLLQFPVLIGLFYALRSSIGLRHAPFGLWITDLSQPATLFVIPELDFPIRLLPLIMGGSMFVQQKMTPTTGMDPAQAKMMLFMMPAMMLFISYTFPSGLVLYWTVSNLLGIGHQYWIRSQTQPQS
jgi:YidC/Oxa1 family membrane protein insertase